MRVAGRYQRQVESVGNVNCCLGAATLHVQPVALNLNVEVLAEYLAEPLRQSRCLVKLVAQDRLTELAGGASAQTNQSLRVRFQQFLIDAWHIVVAFEESD